MRFEENSHCTFEERIELVAKEILDVYPNITPKEAIEIAKLDEPINHPADNDNKFMRYYYMMLVLQNNFEMIKHIYEILRNLSIQGLKDEKLYELISEIERFLFKERMDFPIISEMYEV